MPNKYIEIAMMIASQNVEHIDNKRAPVSCRYSYVIFSAVQIRFVVDYFLRTTVRFHCMRLICNCMISIASDIY